LENSPSICTAIVIDEYNKVTTTTVDDKPVTKEGYKVKIRYAPENIDPV